MTLNSKGNMIFDGILIMVVVIIFAIVLVMGFNIFGKLNTEFQSSDFLSSENKAVVQQQYDNYPSTFDGIFIFMMVMLWILVLVASYQIDSSPIFFIVSFILFVMVLFAGVMISGVFTDLTGTTEFSGFRTSFPMTTFVFDNFLKLMILMGVSIGGVLYAKSR